MSSYGSSYHGFGCCSDYNGDSDWVLLAILVIATIFIFIVGILGVNRLIEEEEKMSVMNEEQKCVYQYKDVTTKNIPAKCIKYFK